MKNTNQYVLCEGSGLSADDAWTDDGVLYGSCPECESRVYVEPTLALASHRRLRISPQVDPISADEFEAWRHQQSTWPNDDEGWSP